MRRVGLPLLVLVVVLIGLAWSMTSTLQHSALMPSLAQAIPQVIRDAVQVQAQPAQPNVAPPAFDATLADYKRALRSPFANDLAQHVNAPRYDIELILDTATRQITGKQTVSYTNQTAQPLSDLVLRLYPNTGYMGGAMSVAHMRVGTLQTGWSWLLADHSAARVGLLKNIAPNEAITLTLDFTISVPDDPRRNGYLTFGAFDGLWALPNAYAMIAPRQDNRWQVDPAPNFGDIVFSEMALYRVTLHAPASYKVVATGACQSDGLNPFATTTCMAGPVRDFALHLSERYDVASTTVSSITGEPIQLSSYFLPQHRAAGARALDIAANALGSYEKRFGAYPYAELKIFATTTSAGGIEYPNLAGVLYNFYAGNDDYFEWLVAHEVAHQWWYNLVGSNPIQEPWLDESLTQYSALLYMEDRYGVTAAQKYRARYFTDRFAQERKERGDRRVGQPTKDFARWSYFPIVYGKGPLFFDAVRSRSGDVRFTAWLRNYFEHRRYGIAHASDLLQAADDVGLGAIVRAAFDEWIMGKDSSPTKKPR